MILVDTSVWIDHFRGRMPKLDALLTGGQVLTHPFVIGELACGNLKNRAEVLSLLAHLPKAARATDDETLRFIQNHALMGRGLGYIDMHLLASALLSDSTLWSNDRRLHEAAQQLNLAFNSNLQ